MSYFYTNVFLYRGDILLRGYADGRRIEHKIKYQPYLFLPGKEGDPCNQFNLQGQPLTRRDFKSTSKARSWIEEYAQIEGFNYYGISRFIYSFIADRYRGTIQFDPQLIKVMTIDIEVASDKGFPDIQLADKEITAIAIGYKKSKVVFGCGEYTSKDKNVHYEKCKDEAQLLRKFLKFWNNENYSPDVVTGWNVEFFDIPYLVNRISNVLDKDHARMLSPWRLLQESTVTSRGKEQQVFTPVGIAVLDYLQLYKKFTYSQQESYRLDFIANAELGAKKLDYSEYESLIDLYRQNYEKFIDYNIHDVDLVMKLEEKLKFIELVFSISYDAKVNYVDALTSVLLWDILIYNYLRERNIQIPQNKRKRDARNIAGGFVKDPLIGMFHNVVSFDFTSLYPHIIMMCNISPDTYAGKMPQSYSIDELLDGALNKHRDELKEKDLAFAANGTLYHRKSCGFLNDLMETGFKQRDSYKTQLKQAKDEKETARFHNAQLAKKIQLNSAYGALANEYFRWYSADLAEAVTWTGQLCIRWVERNLNKFLNGKLGTEGVDYIIAADTDSVYVNLDPYLKKFGGTGNPIDELDAIASGTIEPEIQRICQELYEYLNVYAEKLFMKREAIGDKAIWTGKKHYIMNVHDNEGKRYEKPKLKMMGIEAVRSSTPQSCRTAIKEVLNLIMATDEPTTQAYIAQFKELFRAMSFEEIAFPRGVNEIDKWLDTVQLYKKGTPMHVKGCIIYNAALRKHGLEDKYPLIYNGDKIKFSYLRLPNPVDNTVISSPGVLPKQIGLDNYLDKDLQFEKAFLEPIKTILTAIGWKAEHVHTLEAFL